MIVEIDPRSAVPPFEQLRVQILALIRSGSLRPGSRLPTVRQLAGDLGVAPNTVNRAYSELERERVVESRGRHGTFVAAGNTATPEEQREHLARLAADFVASARTLGFDNDDITRAVRQAIAG